MCKSLFTQQFHSRNPCPPAEETAAHLPLCHRLTTTCNLYSCSGLPALQTWSRSSTRTCSRLVLPTSSTSSSTLAWSLPSPSSRTSDLASPPCSRWEKQLRDFQMCNYSPAGPDVSICWYCYGCSARWICKENSTGEREESCYGVRKL